MTQPRPVPHDPDAEKAVLGAVLLSVEALAEVAAELQADDFYLPANKAVYEAIVEVERASRPVDCITVADQLKASGTLEALNSSGGVSYLTDLLGAVITTANVGHYARIVRAKAVRRLWAAMALATYLAMASEEGEDSEVLARAERDVLALQAERRGAGPEPMKPILRLVHQELDARWEHRNDSPVTGVPTGFEELDASTSGFQPQDLIVVAGRPSMGKTAWALNVAAQAAAAGVPVLVFSLEMSKKALVERMVSSEGNVNGMEMRTGRISQGSWINLTKAFSTLADRPICIDDRGALTASEIRATARRWRMREAKDAPMGLVVVDYLQLIRTPEQRGRGPMTRDREVAAISADMKAMAKDLRCPVVLLSQLNRSCESRPDKRPMLSDLRDSGCIEQDADVVAFLYRDEVYHDGDGCSAGCERCADKGIAEVIVAKQRNGPTGVIRLTWRPESSKFANLSRRSTT